MATIACRRALPDELGLSIAVADGKGEMPKFQKVLNGSGVAYGVPLEIDGEPETEKTNAAILAEIRGLAAPGGGFPGLRPRYARLYFNVNDY
ncbi:MAG: hypothetical protein ACRD2G_02445 [Terriglobia bacterium]